MSELLFGWGVQNFDGNTKRPGEKGPRNLILDLDGTLICSYVNPVFLEDYEIYSNPEITKKFHPSGSPQICYSMDLSTSSTDEEKIWGLFRPHLYEFLSFADSYFDNIMVWSAGVDSYVKEIIDKIFVQSGFRYPKLVWSREHCAKADNFYHKPILGLSENFKKQQWSTITVDMKNTIIVDDLQQNFLNNPNNGVLIPLYQPGQKRPKTLVNGSYQRIPTLDDLLDRSDEALLDLKNWLNLPQIRNCEDIRLIPKNNIFKQK